jgi:hypothetical protein
MDQGRATQQIDVFRAGDDFFDGVTERTAIVQMERPLHHLPTTCTPCLPWTDTHFFLGMAHTANINSSAFAVAAEWVTITVAGQSYLVAGIRVAGYMPPAATNSNLKAHTSLDCPSFADVASTHVAHQPTSCSVASRTMTPGDAHLAEQHARQTARVVELEEAVRAADARNRELQDRHKQQQLAAREQYERELEALNTTCDSVTAAASSTQANNHQLLDVLKAAQKQVASLSAQVDVLKADCVRLQEEQHQLRAATAGRDDGEGVHEATIVQLKHELAAAVACSKRVEKDHKKQLKRAANEHMSDRAQLHSEVVLMAAQINSFAVMQDKLQSDYRSNNSVLEDVRRHMRAYLTSASFPPNLTSVGRLLQGLEALTTHYEAERRILQFEDTLERQLFLAMVQVSETLLAHAKVDMDTRTSSDVQKRISISRSYLSRHPVGEYVRSQTMELLPNLQTVMAHAKTCLAPLALNGTLGSPTDSSVQVRVVAAGHPESKLSVTISPSCVAAAAADQQTHGADGDKATEHAERGAENPKLRAKFEARMQGCRNARKAR